MNCGQCVSFDHTKYPRHGALGLGVCKRGGFMSDGMPMDTSMIVFRTWKVDLSCRMAKPVTGAQGAEREAWLASLRDPEQDSTT